MENLFTTDTWTKKITDFSGLSLDIQNKIDEIKNIHSNIRPLILKIPFEKNHNLSEIFILSFDSSLYILETLDKTVITTELKYNDINYIELTIILLNSSLLINNGLVNKKIYFNTANEEYFHAIIKKIRNYQNNQYFKDLKSSKLDYLKDINLKLFNYSKFAMKRREDIIDTVYQSANKKQNIESNLTILSTNELVFIKETDELSKPDTSLYGGTWVYIPIKKIRNLKIENNNNKFLFSLILIFKDNTTYKINYTYEAKSSFKEFDKEIKKLL